MPGVVNEVFQARLCLNYKTFGISENYWLRATDWDTARADALKIATVRSWLMGEGAWIEWVDVRQPVYPAPSLPCMQGTMQALKKVDGSPYWGKPNAAGGGINITWRPQDKGNYWRRLWWIADDEVKDNEWVRRGLTVPKVTPPLPVIPSNATPDLLYQVVLGTIRDLTQLAVQLDDLPGGIHQWQTYDFRGVSFGKVASSNPRPRWWRVSWEAADYNYAPHFSPCGCAVDVRRETYEAKCIFYQGGHENQIRYYRASPGVAILPFRTIFNPWYGLVDVKNLAGPGELTGKPIIPWTAGYSWSLAPGTAPTGGPNAFLGLAIAPFDDSLPTPDQYKPPCDFVATPQFIVDNDPKTVEDLNALHLTFGAGLTLHHLGSNHDEVTLDADALGIKVDVTDTGDPDYPGTDELTYRSEDGFWLEQTTPGVVTVGLGSFWSARLNLSGTINNFNPGKVNPVYINLGSNAIIQGIVGGVAGRRLTIMGPETGIFYLRSNGSGATAADRILLTGNTDYPVMPGAKVELWYNGDISRWMLDETVHFRFRLSPLADYATIPFLHAMAGDSEGYMISDSLLWVSAASVYFPGFYEGEAANALFNTGNGLLDLNGGHYGGLTGGIALTILGILDNDSTGSRLFPFLNVGPTRTIKHMDSSVTTAQKIYCPQAVDVVLQDGESCTFAKWAGGWHIAALAQKVNRSVFNEVPTGAVDGSNAVFTLAHAPLPNAIMLMANGVVQALGTGGNYTLSGNVITFDSSSVPGLGWILTASYQY